MMRKNVTLEDVREAISNVKHPAIDCSLIELGMVKDIMLKDNNVTLTLLIPFVQIPENVRTHLVNSLREPISSRGLNVDVQTETMSQKERQHFLAVEGDKWKGLQK